MSSQNSKKDNKKFQMDSEVTRVVLIFLLFLVIIALLVAAFMSLGNGAENTPSQGTVLNIEAPTQDGEVIPPSETEDPNHNNGTEESETIPPEVLNPDLATTQNIPVVETDGSELAPPPETMPGETVAVSENFAYMTTGIREGDPTPVYVVTESPLSTLAPPLTTSGMNGIGNNTTYTETVGEEKKPGDGSVNSVNYTAELSGSASIYSEPNGSANGTVGTNGTFTIVQEMIDSSGVKWGKLKSGAGWVRLN